MILLHQAVLGAVLIGKHIGQSDSLEPFNLAKVGFRQQLGYGAAQPAYNGVLFNRHNHRHPV